MQEDCRAILPIFFLPILQGSFSPPCPDNCFGPPPVVLYICIGININHNQVLNTRPDVLELQGTVRKSPKTSSMTAFPNEDMLRPHIPFI